MKRTKRWSLTALAITAVAVYVLSLFSYFRIDAGRWELDIWCGKLGVMWGPGDYPSGIDFDWHDFYIDFNHEFLSEYVELPLVYFIGPIVILAAWAWLRHRKPGLCAKCGYDLQGSPARCPECGTTHHPLPRHNRDRREARSS